MKLSSKCFALLASSLSLFTINCVFSMPAKAAISCEPGTINSYQNGSLASCVLDQNMSIQVSSFLSGTSNFPCTAKNYILFDEKGQFKSCELSETIQIKTGNSIETCPAEFMVDLSISDKGNQSITCHQLR